MTPLEKLQHRWYNKTGEPMPDAIASLPIGRVLMAVERTEAGEIVFVPPVMPKALAADEGSMMAWDKHGEFS